MSAVPHATLGIFCDEQPIGQATLGLFCGEAVEATVPTTGGGKRRKVIHAKKPDYELGLDLDQLLPHGLSEVTKEVLQSGSVQIDGDEIEVQVLPLAPVQPISALAPELPDIRLDIDREIASLIRAKEQQEYVVQVKKYQEEVLKFEEEFMILLMLLTD